MVEGKNDPTTSFYETSFHVLFQNNLAIGRDKRGGGVTPAHISLIDGVQIKALKVIPDDRGRLMEILRVDDPIFERFGQVYVTTAKPRVVKAWHYHKLQADHWVCLLGRARVGLYDARENSPTFRMVNEFMMTPEEPFLLKIPVFVYHGFKGMDPARDTMVMNVPTVPYNYQTPDEYRVDPYEPSIPFDWKK